MMAVADDELRALIGQTVERIFAGHVDRNLRERAEQGEWPAALWRLVTDAGLELAPATEAAGGSAAGWGALFPVLHGIGLHQAPLPLAETMIAALLASRAGLTVPAGPLAIVGAGPDAVLRLDAEGGGTVVSGSARRVPWARDCGWAVLSAVCAGGARRLALVDLRQPGAIELRRDASIAGEPRDDLAFTRARCEATAPVPFDLPLDAVQALGAMARAAMLSGAIDAALAHSVRYAGERVQFGRPLAKFQAIQQSLAELAGEAVAARTAAAVAARSAPDATGVEFPAFAFDVAVAKIRAGEAASRAAAISHQVHGAIGFSHEHPLNFATRRLWAWRAEFGSDADWAALLGRAAVRAGPGRLWADLTARHLAGGADPGADIYE